jgi:hypothetical protein
MWCCSAPVDDQQDIVAEEQGSFCLVTDKRTRVSKWVQSASVDRDQLRAFREVHARRAFSAVCPARAA